MKVIDGKAHAVCRCNQLGIVSVVRGSKIASNAGVERTPPSRFAKGMLFIIAVYDIQSRDFFCIGSMYI